MFTDFAELINHVIKTLAWQGRYGAKVLAPADDVHPYEILDLPRYVSGELRCAIGTVLDQDAITEIRDWDGMDGDLNDVNVFGLPKQMSDGIVDRLYVEAVARSHPEIFDDLPMNTAAKWFFGTHDSRNGESGVEYRPFDRYGGTLESKLSRSESGSRAPIYLRPCDEHRVITLSVLAVLQTIHDECALRRVAFTGPYGKTTYLSIMDDLRLFAYRSPVQFLRHCVGDWASSEPRTEKLDRICRDIGCPSTPE